MIRFYRLIPDYTEISLFNFLLVAIIPSDRGLNVSVRSHLLLKVMEDNDWPKCDLLLIILIVTRELTHIFLTLGLHYIEMIHEVSKLRSILTKFDLNVTTAKHPSHCHLLSLVQ